MEKAYNCYKVYKAKNNSSEYIVLLAGAAEGGYIFEDCISILQEKINVITFDNPGLNAHPSKAFFTCEDLAKQYVETLASLNIKKYSTMGHCMGGFIAQEMSLIDDQHIENMILIGSSYGSATFFKQMNYLFNDLKLAKMENFMFTDDFITNNKDIVKKCVSRISANAVDRKDLFYNFYAAIAFTSLQRLHNINTRTLLIHGSEDIMVPIKDAEQTAKFIKNSELLTIYKAGHDTFIENPNLMLQVLDFILNNKQIGDIFEQASINDKLIAEDNNFKMQRFSKEFITSIQKQLKANKIEEVNQQVETYIKGKNNE